MKLNDIEFVRLLPQFMREDPACQGLAAGIDKVVRDLAPRLEHLSTWDHVDDLTEAELDALAWELNIAWYDDGASIDVKRELVKNSDLVYRHLGTKWAVENVVNTYFGEGYIEEWFEYNGTPGHFRVYSPNPSINAERLEEFLRLLEKIKRASAKLDGIFITLSGELTLSAGIALHEVGREQYAIGAAAV